MIKHPFKLTEEQERIVEFEYRRSLQEDADKHQKKIAIDTVKNPSKSLLGGPSAKEAEATLRDKFGYDDKKIAKLKEGLSFFVDPLDNGKFNVMNSEGDIHDTYEDGIAARKSAEQLNAQYGELDESYYGREAGRELKIGSYVTAANGQGGEVRKFIDDESRGGRSAKIRFYGSGASGPEFFYVAVDADNKIRESVHEDADLTRLKELAGLNEVKSGNFNSRMIGQRVRIVSQEDAFGKNHFGEEGVIHRASREHTFSQMVPFIIEYGVELDSGEKITIRRDSVRKVKPVQEARQGNETNAEEMTRLKRELNRTQDKHRRDYLRLEIRKLRGEIDLRKEQADVREAIDPNYEYKVLRKSMGGEWEYNEGDKYPSLEKAKQIRDNMKKGATVRTKFKITRVARTKLAGPKHRLPETASGGSTGAGAIASSPVAMNGIQKRNPSIYGQTKLKKKPAPKTRLTKEDASEGIGRDRKD